MRHVLPRQRNRAANAARKICSTPCWTERRQVNMEEEKEGRKKVEMK